MKQHRATEAQCQSVIVAAARRGGWLCHHARPSLNRSGKWSTAIQGDAGFPDLVLAHPSRGVVMVELKRKPAKLSEDQERWREVMPFMVWWVPEELDKHVAWLVKS